MVMDYGYTTEKRRLCTGKPLMTGMTIAQTKILITTNFWDSARAVANNLYSHMEYFLLLSLLE
jgi:hypothetical protein